ncbi:MAG: transglutaminase-like cysteine peptidase [Gammaproteobacteria bacterium]|nr:transglutaminase-like cysteine peptidase [Gammaproteobacteria bacterium]
MKKSGLRLLLKPVYILTVLLLIMSLLYAKPVQQLNSKKIIGALEASYGSRAAKRGRAWFKIMAQSGELTEREKLKKVNRFFNMFRFIDDIKLWGLKNYWATPVEFIGVNGGDCEDYSIAKYFTLLEIGIPEQKMRITMVKAIKLNQYHMVLAYYDTPSSIPLILDNLDGEIKPATKRTDLLPVYSFNGTQLWLNKEKGRGVLAGNSSRLKRWNNLRERLNSTKLKQPKFKME